MHNSESIDVISPDNKIYNFMRTNGTFATKSTIDPKEIFENEILGKFEAIYEEDKKF